MTSKVGMPLKQIKPWCPRGLFCTSRIDPHPKYIDRINMNERKLSLQKVMSFVESVDECGMVNMVSDLVSFVPLCQLLRCNLISGWFGQGAASQ